MSKIIPFKDFNFKLAVIQELMYSQEVLQPQFDIWEYAQNYRVRKIDIDKEGYAPIQEAREYFKNIEITDEMAEKVESLCQDGGDDVYMNIIPFWDGEDDIFNIKSADDAVHFPNLKKVTLFYDENNSILKQFEEKGITAEWL